MTVELGVIVALSSTVIAFLGYQLNRQKHQASQQAIQYEQQASQHESIKNEATRDAILETKLDSISNGVENIRIDLRANERQIGALNERVTRVEESSKQAHHRIDKVEGDLNGQK